MKSDQVTQGCIWLGLENFPGWIMQNFSDLYCLTIPIAKRFFLYLAFFFVPVNTHPLSQVCCGKSDSFLEHILMNNGCCRVLCWYYFCRLNGPKLSASRASAPALVILVASAEPTPVCGCPSRIGQPRTRYSI